MKPWLQSLCHVIFFQKKMTQNPYAFAYVVCVSVSVLRICFASEIDFTFFSRIFCKSVYYAPINVKPVGGGGEGGGKAWGGDLTFFKNLPSNSLPMHEQIIPFNSNQISPPRAAHFCPSLGWTRERHNKNISK